jgi:predicted RNA-binding Zn ribbon-like protein
VNKTPRDFRLGLGHPVLEFVATLGRRQDDQPLERLQTPRDVSDWFALAGLGAGVRVEPELLAEARALREAIFGLVTAARGDRRPETADLRLVNRWARRPTVSPQLDASMRIRWVGSAPGQAVLVRLAAAAVELVAGPDRKRIRNCADPSCSLMFIDRSRPGRRRWCSMERCGNRAKTARYRHQRAQAV